MNLDRLEFHLSNWASWMHSPPTKLGYPSHSSVCLSGGDSAGEDAFEIMCDESDGIAARTMDGMIESLKNPQKVAVFHRWLGVKHVYPTQEYDLYMAYSELCRLADKRGLV